jgi:hypothetical protein
MVEYENKMAFTAKKEEEEEKINFDSEIEVRRGKYRIKKGGKLMKFATRDEAEKALAE